MLVLRKFLLFSPVVIISAFLLSLQTVLWTQGCFRPSLKVILSRFNIPKDWCIRRTRQFFWNGRSNCILKCLHLLLLFFLRYQSSRGNKKTKMQIARQLRGSPKVMGPLLGGVVGGYLTPTPGPWHPGFCSLQCFLLLLIQRRSNKIDEYVIFFSATSIVFSLDKSFPE